MINKISPESKKAIERQTVKTLPNRPQDIGMRAEEVKKAFWSPLIGSDKDKNVVNEINRIVDEVNSEIDKVVSDINVDIDKLNDAFGNTTALNVLQEDVEKINGKLNDFIFYEFIGDEDNGKESIIESNECTR